MRAHNWVLMRLSWGLVYLNVSFSVRDGGAVARSRDDGPGEAGNRSILMRS
jgi:hypothetical protein